MFILMPILLCHDYYSFIVSFEIRNHEYSKLVLLFQDFFLAILVPCISSWIFGLVYQFLQKGSWVLTGIVLNVHINLRSITILTILSFPVHKCEMYFHLFSFFNLFQWYFGVFSVLSLAVTFTNLLKNSFDVILN